MTIISVNNADVFNGTRLERVPNQYFQGSPGNILSPQLKTDIFVDGSGCTLLPGLIDCKIDIDSSPRALSACANFGVTTVIDSISTSAECQAMHLATSENPALPSYLATGSAIGREGASFLGVFPYRAVRDARTPDEARIAVAEIVATNTEGKCIKILVDQPGLDFMTIVAAVEESHKHGRLAMGHASQVGAYKLALGAGFDIVTAVPVDGTLDPEVVRGFAHKDIGVVPTLSYLHNAIYLADSREYDFAYATAAVKQLHEAGVRICAGTAARQHDSAAVLFGHGLREELHLLAEAGLSNLHVLQAATCVPSTLFRLRDRGAIKVGSRADLILVDGNPLEDLAVLNQIRRVWVAGVEIDIGGRANQLVVSQ